MWPRQEIKDKEVWENSSEEESSEEIDVHPALEVTSINELLFFLYMESSFSKLSEYEKLCVSPSGELDDINDLPLHRKMALNKHLKGLEIDRLPKIEIINDSDTDYLVLAHCVLSSDDETFLNLCTANLKDNKKSVNLYLVHGVIHDWQQIVNLVEALPVGNLKIIGGVDQEGHAVKSDNLINLIQILSLRNVGKPLNLILTDQLPLNTQALKAKYDNSMFHLESEMLEKKQGLSLESSSAYPTTSSKRNFFSTTKPVLPRSHSEPLLTTKAMKRS